MKPCTSDWTCFKKYLEAITEVGTSSGTPFCRYQNRGWSISMSCWRGRHPGCTSSPVYLFTGGSTSQALLSSSSRERLVRTCVGSVFLKGRKWITRGTWQGKKSLLFSFSSLSKTGRCHSFSSLSRTKTEEEGGQTAGDKFFCRCFRKPKPAACIQFSVQVLSGFPVVWIV